MYDRVLVHIMAYTMNSYAAQEAQRLIKSGRFNWVDVGEARAILRKEDSQGVWAGSPEGEMAQAYNSDLRLVARYVVWNWELVQDALKTIKMNEIMNS
jgi:hypothetical protein